MFQNLKFAYKFVFCHWHPNYPLFFSRYQAYLVLFWKNCPPKSLSLSVSHSEWVSWIKNSQVCLCLCLRHWALDRILILSQNVRHILKSYLIIVSFIKVILKWNPPTPPLTPGLTCNARGIDRCLSLLVECGATAVPCAKAPAIQSTFALCPINGNVNTVTKRPLS